MKGLLQKTFTSFALCCLILFMVTAPLFYLVTRHFYAEDITGILYAIENGKAIPPLDLERDIMAGMMLQFLLIFTVVSISLFVTMRFITKRIWYPFEDTLRKAETFNVSKDEIPEFMPTDVLEFHRLNNSLSKMIERSRTTYRLEKESIENASHELLTPLAVTRSKLDLLMQEDLSESQLHIVSELYQLNTRMGHLNRNLLLIAKIENAQYDKSEDIQVTDFVEGLLPSYNMLKGNCSVLIDNHSNNKWRITANAILLECLLNNLVVNAIRHSSAGEINIDINQPGRIAVSNPAADMPLDSTALFSRFRSSKNSNVGYGLGLAIVKAICDFHGWKAEYVFSQNRHIFIVNM